MNTLALLCIATIVNGQADARLAPSRGGKVPVRAAVVIAKFDRQIPGQEAGVLVLNNADNLDELTEGVQIEKGGLIARIDDSKSRLQKIAAQKEFDSAELQASNDAPVQAAIATTEVAVAEHDKSREINKRSKNAVSEFELRRLQLTAVRSQKQEDVARMEQNVAKATMEVKRAQIDAADLDIKRRQISAPFEGEVVEILKKVGEWVNPGDPVVRLVNRKHMRVQGLLDLDEYSPEQVYHKKVIVTVSLPPNRRATFEGRIDYVNPVVNPTTKSFFVRAEIENRKENEAWVMLPGMEVDMVIDLATTIED